MSNHNHDIDKETLEDIVEEIERRLDVMLDLMNHNVYENLPQVIRHSQRLIESSRTRSKTSQIKR